MIKNKELTDKDLLDIIRRTVEENEIDDLDQYEAFIRSLGSLVCDFFGGTVDRADTRMDGLSLRTYVKIAPSEEIPEGGGIYSKYDKNTDWSELNV